MSFSRASSILTGLYYVHITFLVMCFTWKICWLSRFLWNFMNTHVDNWVQNVQNCHIQARHEMFRSRWLCTALALGRWRHMGRCHVCICTGDCLFSGFRRPLELDRHRDPSNGRWGGRRSDDVRVLERAAAPLLVLSRGPPGKGGKQTRHGRRRAVGRPQFIAQTEIPPSLRQVSW